MTSCIYPATIARYWIYPTDNYAFTKFGQSWKESSLAEQRATTYDSNRQEEEQIDKIATSHT